MNRSKHRFTSRRASGLLLIMATCLALYGCSSNVGVGLSVGIPIGNHGYISVGSNVWR